VSYLVPNTTPAERGRGCRFAERHESAAKVVLNRGTIFGTPTFDDDGIVLNGTTDYEKFDIQGYEFLDPEFSAIIPIWPDFDWDESTTFTFFDTESSKRYLFYKKANGDLELFLGNSLVATISAATYSSYWTTGEQMLLAISGTSGNTNAWLISKIGTIQIITNDSTVWTQKKSISLFIGAGNTGVNKFRGKIGSVRIFKSLLTEQEFIDEFNGTTYTYREKAIVDLPMLACQHDPGNTQTIDVSPYGNNAQFGDGVTPSTYPTKLAKRGYSLDGVDYFKTANVPGVSELTFACLVNLKDLSATQYIGVHSDSAVSVIQFLLLVRTTDFRFYAGGLSSNNAATAVHGGRKGIYTLIGTADGTTTALYVNGGDPIYAAIPLAPSIAADQFIALGVSANLTTFKLTGDLYQALKINRALTHLQVIDLHKKMMMRINQV